MRVFGAGRGAQVIVPTFKDKEIEIVSRSDYTGPSTNSHSVPYASNISGGNFLVLIVRHGNAAWAIDTPSGWDLLLHQVDTGSSYFFTRIADGNESGSVTITSGFGNRNVAAVMYNIKNAKKVLDIELTVGSYELPIASVNWSGRKKVCIASLTNVTTNNGIEAYPTGFEDGLSVATSPRASQNAHVRVSVCNKYVNETESPAGEFKITGTMNNPHVSSILIV